MRWFCVSLLLAVLSLAAVIPASWPAAAQDKSTFAVSILVEHNNVRQKYNVQLLIWDDGLAKLAQDWADKIAASGAMPPAHRASGENLFWGTADQWPVKDVLAAVSCGTILRRSSHEAFAFGSGTAGVITRATGVGVATGGAGVEVQVT